MNTKNYSIEYMNGRIHAIDNRNGAILLTAKTKEEAERRLRLHVFGPELYEVVKDSLRMMKKMGLDHEELTKKLEKAIGKVEGQEGYITFVHLKEKYDGSLLFIKTGNGKEELRHYTCFEQDADAVCKTFDIEPEKAKIVEKEYRFVSFATNNIDDFLPKLINAGYRVAICNQM